MHHKVDSDVHTGKFGVLNNTFGVCTNSRVRERERKYNHVIGIG